jgi:hypothetical protein
MRGTLERVKRDELDNTRPRLGLDLPLAVRRPLQRRVVEHQDSSIACRMDICHVGEERRKVKHVELRADLESERAKERRTALDTFRAFSDGSLEGSEGVLWELEGGLFSQHDEKGRGKGRVERKRSVSWLRTCLAVEGRGGKEERGRTPR